MTREIKFRAWSKRHNQMWGVASLSWIIDSSYEEPELDIAPNVQAVGATDGRAVSKVGMNPAKDIILMQYTGLCDKNGTDIYEGDIVKNPDGVAPVAWLSDGYVLSGLDAGDSMWETQPLMYHPISDIEVIGNIYENPELLERSS